MSVCLIINHVNLDRSEHGEKRMEPGGGHSLKSRSLQYSL